MGLDGARLVIGVPMKEMGTLAPFSFFAPSPMKSMGFSALHFHHSAQLYTIPQALRPPSWRCCEGEALSLVLV